MGNPIAAIVPVPVPGGHFETKFRRSVCVENDGGAVFVKDENVVFALAVEFVPPQAGLLPVDAVRRLGIQDDVPLPFAQAGRALLVAAA